jgi:hypothetical protein
MNVSGITAALPAPDLYLAEAKSSGQFVQDVIQVTDVRAVLRRCEVAA